MNLTDFQTLTDDAFSFLLVDHAYVACPAERGGHLHSAFVRRFVRGSNEVGIGFGDVDSSYLCSVWFRDDVGQDIAERSYMTPGLAALLAERSPAFAHPTRADLSDEVTPESIVRQYAQLVRRFAIDVVEGDFSVFPKLMYVLHHVDRKFPGGPVRRFLGTYSTYQFLTAAIEERRLKRGYAERPDGFEIWRVRLDGHGFWFAGIPLDDSRDNRG